MLLLCAAALIAGTARAADDSRDGGGRAKQDARAEVTVYKSATCGCCNAWIQHLERNGFTVKAHNVTQLDAYKQRHGVTPPLAACHTAVVDGYVVEGHVPAADIKRLLKERPPVKGIAVPGMPMGSPGMEGPTREPYSTLSFDDGGRIKVYARH
jgi:hypothetical protein